MIRNVGNFLVAVGTALTIWAASWSLATAGRGVYAPLVYAGAAFQNIIASSNGRSIVFLVGIFLVVLGREIANYRKEKKVRREFRIVRRRDIVDPRERSKEKKRWICTNPDCLTPNPDNGERCGNCDELVEESPPIIYLPLTAHTSRRESRIRNRRVAPP